MSVYRAHVNGYTFTATSVAELQTWIDARKVDCKGHEIRIHKGVRHGTADVFARNCPTRVAVL